jgi:hypothetical protein
MVGENLCHRHRANLFAGADERNRIKGLIGTEDAFASSVTIYRLIEESC